ncbi:hypothetical protein AB1Y20_007351 [Prymnesium parvum]|uniref:Uncharacterized protein n=1 Tax=Prymnesium parvum TaxID=97485 RepID=A0AB34IXA4_PRYPA
MCDGKYVLARRAEEVGGVLGVWVSTSCADDMEVGLTEEVFQALPFEGGRGDSARLIILGFLQGKFTHGYTGRDYWVTDVEANDYGVRAVTIAPSPSGAISQGRAVRRTVDEFISAFLSHDATPVRSPAPAARTAAAGGRNPGPQLALTVATLDVSRRPIAKALRLWPHWQTTAPSYSQKIFHTLSNTPRTMSANTAYSNAVTGAPNTDPGRTTDIHIYKLLYPLFSSPEP